MAVCWLQLSVLLSIISMAVSMCPGVCQCPNSTYQVTCADNGLAEIPSGLAQSVTTLDMSGNQITAINVDDLAHLRNLVNLKVGLNEIQTIQDGSFERLENLQTLDLSGNKLRSIHQKTFLGAQRLLHLDLSSNQLEHIDGAFADMTQVSRLDLRNNQIQRISQFTFRDLENLRYLLLTDNEISHIDKRAFRNLSKLMYLVLKGNPIHKVPKFEFNSYFLSYVDLSECGLKKMPRGLPNSIRYLQLRRNNMTTVSRHSFQDCPYVSILVLDENGIESIQTKTFQHMTYLQQLWLNGNKLKQLPKPLPPSLQRILMDQNRVTTIPGDAFPDNSQLHTLSFMGNNITHIDWDAFQNLPELKSVDLSNNKLEHIYGNTYSNSAKLKTLQLSKNPLRYFHSHAFHGLTTLKTLSLAYVPTNVSMHPDIFQDLSKLRKLDLDSSPGMVRAILSSDLHLRALQSVEDLSVQSCELTTLRGDFPDFFPNLGVLHISSGRWHCDTQLLWMRNWLLSTSAHIEAKDDIVCFTPHDVNGRSLTSLSDYEFEQATTPRYTTTTTTAALTTFGSTTSTTKPKTTTLPQVSKSSSTTAQQISPTSTEKYPRYQFEDYGIDYDEILRGIEDPQLANRNTQDNSTRKMLTWEELLSRTVPPPHREGRFWEGGDQTQDSLEDWETKYKDYDPDLDVRALGKSTVDPYRDPESHKDISEEEGQNFITIIIVASVVATAVIAAILIVTIVYISRKQRRTQRDKKEQPHYQNGIKYKHRNDVLYFMPANGEGGGGEHQHGDRDTEVGSTTDSVRSVKSGRSSKSAKSSRTQNGNSNGTKEGMTLIPGRDINHEGPHRVYRWEEF